MKLSAKMVTIIAVLATVLSVSTCIDFHRNLITVWGFAWRIAAFWGITYACSEAIKEVGENEDERSD